MRAAAREGEGVMGGSWQALRWGFGLGYLGGHLRLGALTVSIDLHRRNWWWRWFWRKSWFLAELYLGPLMLGWMEAAERKGLYGPLPTWKAKRHRFPRAKR
jgi:hypothetical protein